MLQALRTRAVERLPEAKPATPPPNVSASWGRADWYALSIVTSFALLLRVVGLGSPGRLVFDEAYYAQEACWYVQTTPCGIDGEINFMHPPLGKWIIGAGIELFGYNPTGWRVAVALVGTISVALLYVLARRLLMSTVGASIAAGLIALDLLHLVHSRVAMLDIFVTTFGMAAILGAVLARDAWRAGRTRSAWIWVMVVGACGGAAIATKWTGVFYLAFALVLVVVWETRTVRGKLSWSTVWSTVRARFFRYVIAFGAIPLVLYAATYFGRLEGEVFALPWDPDSLVRAFIGRQKAMLVFHMELDGPDFPYRSSAWTWPLLKRPLAYFFTQEGSNYREILAVGNPLVWWPALAALGWSAWAAVRRRYLSDAALVALGGFAVTYVPWLVLGGSRGATFLFYILPAVPFMCLGLAALAKDLLERRGWKQATFVYLTAVVVTFAFFFPVVTARPLSVDDWRARMIFRDCAIDPVVWDQFVRDAGDDIREVGLEIPTSPAADTPAISPLAPPPDGWCWI